VRKISNDPVSFVVNLKEVKKYGLSSLGQLKRNPGAKLLFPEKIERSEKQCHQRK